MGHLLIWLRMDSLTNTILSMYNYCAEHMYTFKMVHLVFIYHKELKINDFVSNSCCSNNCHFWHILPILTRKLISLCFYHTGIKTIFNKFPTLILTIFIQFSACVLPIRDFNRDLHSPGYFLSMYYPTDN